MPEYNRTLILIVFGEPEIAVRLRSLYMEVRVEGMRNPQQNISKRLIRMLQTLIEQ